MTACQHCNSRFRLKEASFSAIVANVGFWALPKNRNKNRLLVKLILQEGKAPKVRGHSAEENPVLT
jgi:hypothetical protein